MVGRCRRPKKEAIMAKMDAADRLRKRLAKLSSADEFSGVMDVVWRHPEFESRDFTETEKDMRDWGFMLGLAVGLAMAGNPELSPREAAELAFVPARKAFVAWSGEIED